MRSTTGQIIRPIKKTDNLVLDPFDRELRGLPQAVATPIVDLAHGQAYRLQAAPVAKQLGGQTVKMLAYNGSIPGPTLRVRQGSEVVVHFTNLTQVESTVHWHGLRLDCRSDGVAQGEHGGMQPPIPTGDSYTYHLRFPDPGLFWYHPHVREDYTQEHGLYGSILVVPSVPGYWSPVNREIVLIIDDILIEGGMIAPFSRSGPTSVAMGRFGNQMLVNGETDFKLSVQPEEVVRLYLTNTANVRDFKLQLPGAKMKVVGGDNGRVEREEFVESISITPSERVIVDAVWGQPGEFAIEHHAMKKIYPLGSVTVSEKPAAPAHLGDFYRLHHDQELENLRVEIGRDFVREPDKTITLVCERPGMAHSDPSMPAHHGAMVHTSDLQWKIIDQVTGKANHDIDWVFDLNSWVKIRIQNPSDSELPMPHPVHFHGQRFLVLKRDGCISDNLVWKDTVLVNMGETVDILLEASNPGTWMAHCHIAEHLEGNMMFNFQVREEQK